MFCARMYGRFDSIRGAEDGPSRVVIREGKTDKKLTEELLPNCKNVQTKYRTGG